MTPAGSILGRNERMTTIPPARLAELPPHRWEQMKTRMASLDRFLAQEDRSTRRVRAFASELGISKALFYSLLALRESWATQDDQVRPSGPRRARDEVATAMIEEAIALAGPGATLDRVHALAKDLARHRGLPEAHLTLVRRLHGRQGAGHAIGARLGTGRQAILDAAALGVRIVDQRTLPVLAVLNAIVDAGGGVVDWKLTAGAARDHELMPLLDVGRTRFGVDGLLISNAFEEALRRRLASPAKGDGNGMPVVRRGSALLAAVGLKVGRIPILPNTPLEAANEDRPLVDHHDLIAVLHLLMPGSAT